jgi:UDP-N-acetylmuramate--alanine ligase
MKVYFAGMGGSGMSALAALCLDRGWEVMGSEPEWSEVLRMLSARGARVFVPQTGAHLDEPDLVVYTTALREDHPEIVEARKRSLTLKSRPEFLRDLFAEKRVRVAVTGSHGKTTTTAMLGHILERNGRAPAVIAGGIVRGWGAGGRWGHGEIFVAEADESRPTFRLLNPTHLIVCNLDLDHIEAYGTLDRLAAEMREFGNSLPPEGAIWVGGREGVLESLTSAWEAQGRYVRTYGMNPNADLKGEMLEAEGAETRFAVYFGGKKVEECRLAQVGRHFVHNALGAMAMAAELGVPFSESAKALASFTGVSRRWEVIGNRSGATVVSDYAHHPTEIKSLLESAKATRRRVIAIFQPHRYTRTYYLGEKLGEALRSADVVVVTDVYSAGEPESLKVEGRRVYDAVRTENSSAYYAETKDQVFQILNTTIAPGDLVLFVGAGSIHQWALEFAGNAERRD